MIFGIKRKGTFIPSPSDENDAGIRGPMGRADRPRPRLHPLRTDPRHRHAHHIIHWKTAAEPTCQTSHALCSRCRNGPHHGRYTITMDTHTIPSSPTPADPWRSDGSAVPGGRLGAVVVLRRSCGQRNVPVSAESLGQKAKALAGPFECAWFLCAHLDSFEG